MSRVSDTFLLPGPPPAVRQAVLATVAEGWLVDSVAETSVEIRQQKMAPMVRYKVRARVEWKPADDGVAVTIHGQCKGLGPIQKANVRGKVGMLRAGIEYRALH
jgi:hypothetical protein